MPYQVETNLIRNQFAVPTISGIWRGEMIRVVPFVVAGNDAAIRTAKVPFIPRRFGGIVGLLFCSFSCVEALVSSVLPSSSSPS